MSSAEPTVDEPVDDEERELLDEVAVDERNQDEIEAAMGGTTFHSVDEEDHHDTWFPDCQHCNCCEGRKFVCACVSWGAQECLCENGTKAVHPPPSGDNAEEYIEYTQDGPEAQRIASVIPYYPFHGVDRFYDISGMLQDPEAFQLCVDVFTKRYAALEIDAIAGLDARGFVLGPPIALALKKPFVMVRKMGKLPNAVTGKEYFKEYSAATGGDSLCVSRTSIKPGNRVLVIDDLIATGGTLLATIELLNALGATVVECACIVELKCLAGGEKVREKFGVNVWALISEDVLQLKGETS